jgi:hypothetical protein
MGNQAIVKENKRKKEKEKQRREDRNKRGEGRKGGKGRRIRLNIDLRFFLLQATR